MGLNQASKEKSAGLDIQSPLLEYIRYTEFKRLLGQLSMALDKDGHRTLAVLSELPGEGRTFFVSTLALGYSLLLSRQVLVVNTVGPSHNRGLLHEKIFESELQRVPSVGNRMGLTQSIELISPYDDEENSLPISSDFHLSQYINIVKEKYDLVIYDTCALSANNKNNMDPIVIARQSDASVLLNSSRSMDKQVVAATISRLAQWNLKIMGTVFNSGP